MLYILARATMATIVFANIAKEMYIFQRFATLFMDCVLEANMINLKSHKSQIFSRTVTLSGIHLTKTKAN